VRPSGRRRTAAWRSTTPPTRPSPRPSEASP